MLKQYIKLFIITNVFFLIYAIGITWEEIKAEPGIDYYGGFFTWTFLPAVLFFLILYGCYSYVKTKRIILPNLLLMFLLIFYFCWIFCMTPRAPKTFDGDYILEALTWSPVFIGVSVLFGLLVKFVWRLKNGTKRAIRMNQAGNRN